MAEMKTFDIVDLSGVEPLTFQMAGQTFRVPRQLPVEMLRLMGMVAVNDEGQRVYAAAQLVPALISCIAEEAWDADRNEWVVVDDRRRFETLMRSPRWSIDIKVVGELAIWLVEQVTDHPTGAPKP